MPVLFEQNAYRVAVIKDPALVADFRPMLSMPEASSRISFDSTRAIVTSIGVNPTIHAQVRSALGGDMFIYVFGEAPSSLVLGGFCFAGNCLGRAGASGLELMLAWFNKNNAFRRKSAMRVMLGKTPLICFLTGMTLNVADAETGLAQYSATFVVAPNGKGDLIRGVAKDADKPAATPSVAEEEDPEKSPYD